MKALVLQALVLVLVAPAAAMAGEGDTLHRDGLYAEALAAWERDASRGDADAAWRLGAALADGVVVHVLDVARKVGAKGIQMSADKPVE